MNDLQAGDGAPARAPGIAWALALGVGLILLRLIYSGFADLFPEEAYYWNYAKHLDIGYLDHPPMVAWLIHLGTRIFGETEFGVRICTLPCSLVASFFVYRSTLLFYGRREAVFAALLAQVLPFFFMIGFMITPDAPLTACWAGALYFLARVFFGSSARAWLGVGICLGLGMLSKYTIALVGVSALVFMVLDAPSRFWFLRLAPYGAVALSMLIFSPVIFWNAAHHWISFAFQSKDRVAEARRFSTHELLGAMLALLTPVGFVTAASDLLRSESTDPAGARRRLFARVFTLVPLTIFLFFSFTHRVKLNWTGPLWLALLPVIAATLASNWQGRRFLRMGWAVTLVVFPLIYVVQLQYLAKGLPGLGYSANLELLPVGWSEMGHQIEAAKKAARLQIAAGERLLVVGLDRNFIASEAAFYSSDRNVSVAETTGAHLFGGRSLMYELWFPEKAQYGANLLLVSFNKSDLEGGRIRKRCGKMGDVEEHWLIRDGKKIRPYYTRLVFAYQSSAAAVRK